MKTEEIGGGQGWSSKGAASKVLDLWENLAQVVCTRRFKSDSLTAEEPTRAHTVSLNRTHGVSLNKSPTTLNMQSQREAPKFGNAQKNVHQTIPNLRIGLIYRVAPKAGTKKTQHSIGFQRLIKKSL